MPSMIGSLKGIPISTASAPACTAASTCCVQSGVRPAMKYGTSALRPLSLTARSFDSKDFTIRLEAERELEQHLCRLFPRG